MGVVGGFFRSFSLRFFGNRHSGFVKLSCCQTTCIFVLGLVFASMVGTGLFATGSHELHALTAEQVSSDVMESVPDDFSFFLSERGIQVCVA